MVEWNTVFLGMPLWTSPPSKGTQTVGFVWFVAYKFNTVQPIFNIQSFVSFFGCRGGTYHLQATLSVFIAYKVVHRWSETSLSCHSAQLNHPTKVYIYHGLPWLVVNPSCKPAAWFTGKPHWWLWLHRSTPRPVEQLYWTPAGRQPYMDAWRPTLRSCGSNADDMGWQHFW